VVTPEVTFKLEAIFKQDTLEVTFKLEAIFKQDTLEVTLKLQAVTLANTCLAKPQEPGHKKYTRLLLS